MIVSLKVPDELYEAYGRKNSTDPRAPMVEALAKFVEEDPRARSITLSGENLSEVQNLIGGPVDSPPSLLDALRKSLRVRLDDVEVTLSPSQRKAIETSCGFFKLEQRQFIENKLREALIQVFGV